MPSPASLACFVMLALAANAAAPADAVPQASAVADAAVSVPDDSAVQGAIAALREDPLMGGTHRVQRLHWRTKESEEPAKPQPWLRRVVEWIIAAAQWLARNMRALLIVATALGAAMLAVLISRNWRRHSRIEIPEDQPPPTHVRGLDIRPDELPEDVGRAARHLWERGDRRGALILLYRALLSRLVHRYHAAIRDSSTEGDCLRQAARKLPAAPLNYVSRFVACWQRAMYAASWPEPADFEQLCAGFEAALPAPLAGAAAGAPEAGA
jgi:Domain of unknown function (DUF4129)